MARKSKKSRKIKKDTQDLVNLEASLKKIQSSLTDPNILNWIGSGGARGIREKILKIDYNVLRNVVDRVPLINSIINTRVDQICGYASYVSEEEAREGAEGFRIVAARNAKEKFDQNKADQLGDFFEQTGFVYSDEREDDLSDYIQMFIRETLTVDQVATELQYNLAGEVCAFWILDASTIKRTTPDYKKKNVSFIQELEQKIVAEYNYNNLIFDYKNKRADIRFRGYGYSNVEMCIDLITTILFGYAHIRDQFVRDKIPKGFISVMGDIDQPGINAIQNYWYQAMSGAGGQWSIPILPSGKDGVGIDFKTIQSSNRDMEYHRMMMFLSSMIAAVFSIDLAELGIKADDSTSLIGESSQPRIEASMDRGKKSAMLFLQQHLNKILRKVSVDYKIVLTAFDTDDASKRAEIKSKMVATDTTVNELRKKEGKDPLPDSYANVVLNPQAIQIFLKELELSRAKEAQGAAGQDTEDQGDDDLGGFPWEDADEQSEDETDNTVDKSEIPDDFEELKKSFFEKTRKMEMLE
jgi:hypothetical protein